MEDSITHCPGRAMSSLRVARITNIWQGPLLMAALMPPSVACMWRVRVHGGARTKPARFLVGRRSNTEGR